MLTSYERRKASEARRFDEASRWLDQHGHPKIRAQRPPKTYAVRPKPKAGFILTGSTARCPQCNKHVPRNNRPWGAYCTSWCFIQGPATT